MKRFMPGSLDFVPLLLFGAAWATADRFLADSDTGWHIRVGQTILVTGQIPHQDTFSFSAQKASWFAWEWLADVVMSVLHDHFGLAGLCFFCGVFLALVFGFIQRFCLFLGSGSFSAMLITLLGAPATAVHWLARPHLVSMFFAPAFLWILEFGRPDRSRAWLFLLPALTLFWCNMHGGFVVGWLLIGAYWCGSLLPGAPARWRSGDLAVCLALCVAASFCNPYGLALHQHMLEYLQDNTILRTIEEFRSPDFQKGASVFLEIWLLAIVCTLIHVWRLQDWPRLFLLLGLTHMTLTSHRHITLLVACSAPLIAAALPKFEHIRLLEANEKGHLGLWAPAILILWCALGPLPPVSGFPSASFPVQAVPALQKTNAYKILSTDSYGGYLIYCCWPQIRVFVDGRSDFYRTTGVFDDYLAMIGLKPGWLQKISPYAPEAALLPKNAPMASWLLMTGRWRLEYEDEASILLLPISR